MATPSYQPPVPAGRRSEIAPQQEPSGWTGWIVFAGTMLILVGIWNIIDGFVALFDNTWYAVAKSGLLINTVNYSAWGWFLIAWGVLMVLAGPALFYGRTWGRIVAVIVAGLNLLLHVAFISAYPLWSVLIIALDVFVIYAVTAHGSEMQQFGSPV